MKKIWIMCFHQIQLELEWPIIDFNMVVPARGQFPFLLLGKSSWRYSSSSIFRREQNTKEISKLWHPSNIQSSYKNQSFPIVVFLLKSNAQIIQSFAPKIFVYCTKNRNCIIGHHVFEWRYSIYFVIIFFWCERFQWRHNYNHLQHCVERLACHLSCLSLASTTSFAHQNRNDSHLSTTCNCFGVDNYAAGTSPNYSVHFSSRVDTHDPADRSKCIFM